MLVHNFLNPKALRIEGVINYKGGSKRIRIRSNDTDFEATVKIDKKNFRAFGSEPG